MLSVVEIAVGASKVPSEYSGGVWPCSAEMITSPAASTVADAFTFAVTAGVTVEVATRSFTSTAPTPILSDDVSASLRPFAVTDTVPADSTRPPIVAAIVDVVSAVTVEDCTLIRPPPSDREAASARSLACASTSMLPGRF